MKGSMLDLPVIVIGLFLFSIVILISGTIIDEFQTATANITTSSGNSINQTLISKGETALQSLDYMIMFAVIGLGIASIIFAFFIRSHPVFFVISIILLIFFALLSSFFTNSFVEFVEVDPIDVKINDYPLMYSVMTNLPIIITAIGILIAIALYAKSGTEVGV